jgi:hypothetical protein
MIRYDNKNGIYDGDDQELEADLKKTRDKHEKWYRDYTRKYNEQQANAHLVPKDKWIALWVAQAKELGRGKQESIYRQSWDYPLMSAVETGWQGIGSGGGISSSQADRASDNRDFSAGTFNSRKAYAHAAQLYDEELKTLEKYMGDSEKYPFSPDQYSRGKEQTDWGVATYPGYKSYYDHEKPNSPEARLAKEQWDQAIALFQGPPGTTITKMNAGVFGEGTNDDAAFQLANMLQADMKYAYGKSGEKAGHPKFDIAYYQKLSDATYEKTDGSIGTYGGYVITLDEQYADQYKSSKAGDPKNNLLGMDTWNSNSFTIFVKEEDDNNTMKSSNQQFSRTDAKITYDGSDYSDDAFFPGGGYRIWRENIGNQPVYYQDVWTYGYDSKTGNFKREQFIPPSIISIGDAAIQRNMLDGYVKDLSAELTSIKESNLNIQKKNKLAKQNEQE